jgi:uncharacterized protein (DUF983 family)
MQDNQNNNNQKDFWQKIRYFLRFKSPKEGLKSITKDDIPALTVILLFGIICLTLIIIIAFFMQG